MSPLPSKSSNSPRFTSEEFKQIVLDYYQAGCKNTKDVVIGMEVEKHGIYQNDRSPIPYFGSRGLKKIQEKMMEELGWKACKKAESYLLALERCGSHLTLETSESMSELSGRTHPSIHDLARELEIHQHEESVMSKVFGVLWLGIGIQPFSKNSKIRPLLTPRYKILYQFLKKQGGLWEDELKKTASVQANIDYTSEKDARKKFQTLLRLSPFLGAMYAHSPLLNGVTSGYVSYRMHVLTQNDPNRFGIRKFFFENDFTFERWYEFCLNIPMVSVERKGKWHALPKNLTFRKFLERGCNGFYPTLNDWIVHTGFVYTFVRIKKYIELRLCDSVPPLFIPSIQGIVRAFVYHPDGERALKELTKKWNFHDFESAFDEVAKKGLQARVKGEKLLDSCKVILNQATDFLRSFKVYNERKEDESVYLRPIKDFIFVKEQSLGEYVADQWDGDWSKNPERLIEWCRYD